MTHDQNAPSTTDNTHPFRLRVVPWWTDDCSTFLNNVFKWLPPTLTAPPITLEFGGGNSTLYLLGKGSRVVTIESDDRYIDFIASAARNIGFKTASVNAESFSLDLMTHHNLVIIKAKEYADVSHLVTAERWDFIVNDGIARKELLSTIHQHQVNSVVILDNVEYCANWGRLDRSSAKPDLIKVYRSILRDSQWRHYIFEQPEGREGRGSADKSGWESPHRWASAVLWPSSHLFTRLMLTQLGFPLVNGTGEQDADLASLAERCPFDWNRMEWDKAPFPAELDLKLQRNFD